MASNKQSGFSAVLSIVAIVLVIGVLGLIGWRVYSQPSAKTNDATSNNTNTSKTPASNNTRTTPQAQQTDPNAGYFVIKEWGVRFKPASGLDGLRYAIQSSNSVAVFSTPSITAVDPKCSETATGFSGIGSLSRYAVGTQQPFHATTLTTIDGYSYYYSGSGGGDCVSDINNTAGQTLLHNEEQALSNSIKSLEAEQPIDPYAGWKTFCSVNGGVCFRYPADWQEVEKAKDDKTGGDYVTVTSPSGAILVNYIPIVMGIGGGCPSGCYFKAESMNQYPAPNTLGLEVIKGVFTYKDNPSVAADYFLASSDQMARYKLQLNQSVEVGAMYGLFTSPLDSKSIEELYIRVTGKDDGFASVSDAEAWLNQPEVVTGGKILSSVYISK